jgi:MFS family permease
VSTTRSRGPLVFLLIANYLSWFGNVVTVVAVPLFVLEETGSSVQTGLAGFANTLPLVFAGAVGGVLVDRVGGRRVGIVSDLIACALTATIPLLHGTAGLPLPALLVLLFGRALAATPAGTARLSQLAPLADATRVRRETANTVYHSAPRLALVLAPPLSAALVSVIGGSTTLYLDAASFLLAALLTLFGVPATPFEPGADRVGFVRQLREGLAFVIATPTLGAILAVVVVTNFIDDAFAPVLFPVYATEVAGDPRALGWLLAAGGVGAVIGTFGYAPASRGLLSRRYATFVGCFAIVAIMRATMVLLPDVAVMAVLAFVIGLAAGPLNPLLATVMQEQVPEELRGRVFGLTSAVVFASVPLGVLAAGWSVEAVGLRWSLTWFAVLYLLLVAATLKSRALRGLDRVT